MATANYESNQRPNHLPHTGRGAEYAMPGPAKSLLALTGHWFPNPQPSHESIQGAIGCGAIIASLPSPLGPDAPRRTCAEYFPLRSPSGIQAGLRRVAHSCALASPENLAPSNSPHVRHALHPNGSCGLQSSVLEEVPHVRRACLTFGSLRRLRGADLESERDLCRRVISLR
jgi:hypothetical protein